MGEVRPELLNQLGVDAIPDQAVREEAPGALQAQTRTLGRDTMLHTQHLRNNCI